MDVYLCDVCGHCVVRDVGVAPIDCCNIPCRGKYQLATAEAVASVAPSKLLWAAADGLGVIPMQKVRELLGDDWRPVVVGVLAMGEAEFVRNERGGWCSILRLKPVPARGRAA